MPKSKNTKIIIEILLAVIPLCIGYCLYLIFDPDIFITRFFYDIFKNADSSSYAKNSVLYFLRCYICDVLWAFSFGITIWIFCVKTKVSLITATAFEIVFCFILEFLQINGIVPGTFDVVDLITETLAVIAACLINKKIFLEGEK